jgi:hypothetical protein
LKDSHIVRNAALANDAASHLAATSTRDDPPQFAKCSRRIDRTLHIGIIKNASTNDRPAITKMLCHRLTLFGIEIEDDYWMAECEEPQGGYFTKSRRTS